MAVFDLHTYIGHVEEPKKSKMEDAKLLLPLAPNGGLQRHLMRHQMCSKPRAISIVGIDQAWGPFQ